MLSIPHPFFDLRLQLRWIISMKANSRESTIDDTATITVRLKTRGFGYMGHNAFYLPVDLVHIF